MSEAMPLAALAAWFPDTAEAPRWATDAWEVPGRALIESVRMPARFALALDRPVTFRSHARLVPHEWLNATGAVRAAVVAEISGERSELWSATLPAAAEYGDDAGVPVLCELPAATTALVLEAHTLAPGSRPLTQMMWLAPELIPSDQAGRRGAASPGAARTPAGERPQISVLMPVHDPPLAMLQEAVGSVQSQTYPDWQLCLVDDGSRRPEIIAALDAYAAADPRIVLHRHPAARGIAEATNAALALAQGTFAALLDHDDWLEPSALDRVAQRLAGEPDLDMVYTDEDIVMDGRAIWVHAKPGWSPDLLRTNGYTCHLGVYRVALMREIGGFRSAYDGSQDVDMILRLIERSDRVGNVPEILYHWRAHASSTAGGDAKPYAYVSAARAISGHLERIGVPADVDYGPPGLYRVVHRVDPETRVALVLALDSAEGFDEALASWHAQSHPAWELVVAGPAAVLETVTLGEGVPGVAVPVADGTSAAQALARAAQASDADHLVLMQAPMIGVTHDWLRRLLGYSAQPGIAAAGPVVLADDGRVVHSGIAMPDGLPLRLLYGRRTSMDELFGFGTSVHNLSALSGVLATSRETYLRLGGLDPALGDLCLTEYTLRAWSGGERIVTVPDARLRLSRPEAPVNDLALLRELRRRWRAGPASDPYYSPSYHFDRGDFALR